jgi:serine/threonine protein phosphatase PrpC
LFDVKSYSIPKNGNSTSENEDAKVILPRKHVESSSFLRCAVSDGATQASFSRLWAKLLVNESAQFKPSKKRLDDVIRSAQLSWTNEIVKYDLPWHAEEKIKKGAFATLLWLNISKVDATGGKYKALAFGDSNLFVIRKESLHISFPIQDSQKFGNDPILISSIPARNENMTERINILDDAWTFSDEFILATDALAYYLLKEFEQNKSFFSTLKETLIKQAAHYGAFQSWIQSLRESNELKNDDTTLVWIRTVPALNYFRK